MLGGIIAGAVALVIVFAAVVAVVVRKSTDNAKKTTEPSTSRVEPSGSPGGGLFPNFPSSSTTGGKPSGGTAPGAPGVPTSGANPAPITAPPTAPGAPQFQATFLGSQGQGRRFCIIADNSGSMLRNIPDLRAQLLKTVNDLNADSEFYIIAFNNIAEPMPHHTWVKAGGSDAQKIKTWVNTINSRGGTNPVPAFDLAFRLNPPPDVIFFMTDGIFANTAPAKVVEFNGSPRKSVVNTIMFANALPKFPGAPPPVIAGAEDQLKLIATQNGGTFTRFVP